MNTENKLAKLMRNSGPARTFVPADIIILIFGILMLGMKSDTFEETVGYVTSVEEHTNDEKQKENHVRKAAMTSTQQNNFLREMSEKETKVCY